MQARPFTPRLYQPMSIDFTVDVVRGMLLAQMGLGKTVSVLAALERLYFCGLETQPTLVAAPLRVAQSTWPDEAKKWADFPNVIVSAVVGTEKQRLAALAVDASVYTTNYEQLPWLVDHFGASWPFGTVICDESTRIKSLRVTEQTSKLGKKFLRADGGVRSRGISKLAHSKVRRWINLSGTPAPNGLQDLYGQMWPIDGGARLGRSYTGFMERWFERSYTGHGVHPKSHAQEEIQEKLRDVCLSINAKDWFDIKDPIVLPIYVDLPPKARAIYRDMEKHMFAEIEGNPVEAFNAAARTIKCLQLANGAAFTDDSEGEDRPWAEVHDVKLQALESIIAEAAGMPVLVAYHFKPDLVRLRKAFPKGRVLDKDPQTIKDWNAGKIPILFAHPMSAGHGLNLQDGGNILVYFAVWWALEPHMQILERIGPVRQMQSGHVRPVFVYQIIARDTVDEDVITRHESKAQVQDILMAAMKRRKAA